MVGKGLIIETNPIVGDAGSSLLCYSWQSISYNKEVTSTICYPGWHFNGLLLCTPLEKKFFCGRRYKIKYMPNFD